MHQISKSSARGRDCRRPGWLVLVAVACLCACGTAQPPLNSDLIEDRFGSYGVEVLYSSRETRRASLYSVHDGRRVCRTYAVVHWRSLPDFAADSSLAAAHERILDGASLGATLRTAGWTLEKRTRFAGELPALAPEPPWLGLMSVAHSAGLAVHIYDLSVKKSTYVIEYARISEVHHPEYLDARDLQSRYPVRAGDALDAHTREQVFAALAASP